MRLIDAPVGLLDRLRDRRPIPPEDPVARRLADALGAMEPDPLFRRRLRGETVNRYLAVRDGLAARSRRNRRQMGRLGRAVLYASFALAVSVTAVGAAAQQSLPGDALYGVKLRLEELRIEIAPASMRPQLAEMALEQRLGEVEELASRGDWAGLDRAISMVERAAASLAAYGLGSDVPGSPGLERRAAVLNRLAAEAPPTARARLEQAIQASAAATAGTGASGAPFGTSSDHAPAGGTGNGNQPGSGAGSPAGHPATAAPGKPGE